MCIIHTQRIINTRFNISECEGKEKMIRLALRKLLYSTMIIYSVNWL